MDRQVDIFQIIERAGVWLMFQPTRRLFGAYQRRGEAAGIILNSNHPSTLQRYTAAHEYGHHVLGHQESLDDQEHIEVFTPGLNDLEVAAQAFAADFLIPLQVVNHALRIMDLPIRQPNLSAVDAYKLSLHLGARSPSEK
jgi:Zn-dependent peptidase ImmA (M78 family)